MELNNSVFLQKILSSAEEMRIRTNNKYLSKEMFLLTLCMCTADPNEEDRNDKDFQAVSSILAAGFTDTDEVMEALKKKIGDAGATAEDGHSWFTLLHNTKVIARQINASEISAAILVQVLLADPPECVRPFMVSEKEAEKKKNAAMFVKDADELAEADEFVDFVHEVRAVAPILRETGTEHTLTSQALLFAVEQNESAVMTYLYLLHDLYNSEKLVSFHNPPDIIAISADMAMDGSVPSVTNFTLNNVSDMVLCIDISAWIGKMDTVEFETLLMKLYDRINDFVFVFRVPCLENTVLEKIAEQIQDIFSLRVIRFIPWSASYICDIADKYLESCGFPADADALEAFRIRMNEEREDGRFYGYSTIQKICDEMIYLKQLQMADMHSSDEDRSEAVLSVPENVGRQSRSKTESASNAEHKSGKTDNVPGNAASKDIRKATAGDRRISLSDVSGLINGTSFSAGDKATLNTLIGRSSVREQLQKIIKSISGRLNDKSSETAAQDKDHTFFESPFSIGEVNGPYNMFFIGEPGTGKSSAAGVLTAFLKEMNILYDGHFHEHHLEDFLGDCEGETTPRTLSILRDAYGSLLLIDELNGPMENMIQMEDDDVDEDIARMEQLTTENFTADAINTIISQLRIHRDDLVVVFSGREKDIRKLCADHPELEKLVPYSVVFEKYTQDELAQIFMNMLERNQISGSPDLEKTVFSYFRNLPEKIMQDDSFSNARFVSNLFEHAVSKADIRSAMDGTSGDVILASDFLLAAKDSSVDLNRKKKANRTIGFAIS